MKDLLGQAKDVIQIKEEKASDEGRHQGVERQLGATERNRTPRVGKSSSKSGKGVRALVAFSLLLRLTDTGELL